MKPAPSRPVPTRSRLGRSATPPGRAGDWRCLVSTSPRVNQLVRSLTIVAARSSPFPSTPWIPLRDPAPDRFPTSRSAR
jgi:hypothetical protein